MSASSEPSASEFARVNVHSSSTTVTSATSAAFKLTSTTTTSFIISLITKKFHDLAPGSLIITATTPTMPTHYLSFEKEPFEESRYYPPSSESPPLPTSLLKDIKDNTPPSFTLLKTLKPDELALEQRDHLTTRLTDEIIRAGGDAEAPITIKWYYKIHTSSPLDIPGDISGDEVRSMKQELPPPVHAKSSPEHGRRSKQRAKTQDGSECPGTVCHCRTSERAIARPTSSSPLTPSPPLSPQDEDWDAPLADLILDTASTAPDISTFYTDIEASLNTPHLPPSGPPLPPPPQTRARTGTLIPSRADFLTYDFLLLQSFADANLWRRTWVILTDDKLWMVSRRGNHGEGGERSRCIPLVRNTVKETGKDNPVQNGIGEEARGKKRNPIPSAHTPITTRTARIEQHAALPCLSPAHSARPFPEAFRPPLFPQRAWRSCSHSMHIRRGPHRPQMLHLPLLLQSVPADVASIPERPHRRLVREQLHRTGRDHRHGGRNVPRPPLQRGGQGRD